MAEVRWGVGPELATPSPPPGHTPTLRLSSQNSSSACPPTTGITYDMHCVLDVDSEKHNQIAQDIWANAEVFDWRAEAVFKYIQVGAVQCCEARDCRL